MFYRQCPAADLQLSSLGLGCWEFGGGEYWGDTDQASANAIVSCAVEHGINYFDTAEAYNDGRSERALGLAIRGLPRERLIIGTKVSPNHCYPETLVDHCHASLQRLGTDYIDLYMVHWPINRVSLGHFTGDASVAPHLPCVEDMCATLNRLKQEGKIRRIGVSNFGIGPLQQMIDLGCGVAVNELPYGLLTRAIELEVLPACRKAGIGVIGYMPLLQGLLADIYPTLDDVPPWQRRTRHFNAAFPNGSRHGGAGIEAETAQAIADIRKIARDCGLTMPVLALKWAMVNPDVTCILTGTRKPRELEENVQSVNDPLPEDIIGRLNTVTLPVLQALGPSFDYYEHPDNDRTRVQGHSSR